jgi:PAS domain S-box-containing protein
MCLGIHIVLGVLSRGNRRQVVIRAGLLIAAIAAVDWKVQGNVSLGFLYLFPMLLVGASCRPWQIGLTAAICTLLVEWFDPFPFIPAEGIPRVILVFAAFSGSALFAYESSKNRRQAMQHLDEIQSESERRRDAEEQLRVLVESSPAAIFTLDAGGRVLLANEAVHRLLDVPAGSLPGQTIRQYLPAIASIPFRSEGAQIFRTEMECRGQRANGEAFLASVWFSSYRTRSGPRLAAVVADVSEERRDREESGLRQLMSGSRVLIATVCHELRNVCAAISVLHAKIGRTRGLEELEDYRALGTLVESLERIAALELQQSTSEQTGEVDLNVLIDELRVVIEPQLHDSGIGIEYHVAPSLPAVRADRYTLLQVFLNLMKNSARAVESCELKSITITASPQGPRVVVRVIDSGSGVSAPQKLFQPFQPGAESTGLGLFVSRALVRGFGGDLTYEPQESGSCFAITLVAAGVQESSENENDAALVSGRSRSLS